MNSTEHNGAALPSVEWKPVWPVTWTVPEMITVALMMAASGLGTIGFLCLAASSAVDGGTIFTVVGGCGAAIAMAGLGAMVVGRFELLNNRFSLGVQGHADRARGEGVLLPGRRAGVSLIPVLTGFAAYGVCAWFDWQDGSGNSLLPVSKNSAGGANFALVLGILLIVLLIPIVPKVFQKKTEISLYPAGINWDVAPHLGGASVFVEWVEVESIQRGEVTASRTTLDVINIYCTEAVNSEPGRPDHYAIPVHRLVCDSNALISVMCYLHEHPEDRGVLADPAVSQLFALPSLRERMRRSRSNPAPKD